MDNLPCGIDAVEIRHRDVGNYYIRDELPHKFKRLSAIFGFADHFHIRFLFNQGAQALTCDSVILS